MPQNEFAVTNRPSGQYRIPGIDTPSIEFIFLDEKTRQRVSLDAGCKITFEEASEGVCMHVKDARGNPLLIGLKGRDRCHTSYLFDRTVVPTGDFCLQAAQFLAENAGSIPLQVVAIMPGAPVIEPLVERSRTDRPSPDSDNGADDTLRLRMSVALDERHMFRLVGT